MGANPQQQALAAAQSSVEQAIKQGQKLTKTLQKRGGKYRDMADTGQAELLGFLGEGQDPASYYERISGSFEPFMTGEQTRWQSQLNEGDYPVLGSPAHQRFEDTLMKTADIYEQYAKRALPEIKYQFQDIAQDPAFNLQYDPRAMQMAQGNINQDQVRRLTTYNV